MGFKGKARIFNGEKKLLEKLDNNPDFFNDLDMIIVRYEGPVGAPGMPEMLDPTPIFVIITYLFAPLPNLVCGACQRGGSSSGFGVDSGFFLTGAIVVTGLALPLTHAHVDIVETPAAIMAVVGGLIPYSAILSYTHVFADKEDDFF